MLKGILVAYPEGSVVLASLVSQTNLLPQLRRPLWRLVAPVTFPFIMSQGASEVKELITARFLHHDN